MENILKNKYKILETMHQDWISSICLAHDVKFDNKKIINEIHLSNINTESLIRFRKELSAVALLRHPHIIRIYEILEEKDQLFIITEYFPGKHLGEAGQGLSLMQKIEVIKDLADTLSELHQQGIIHKNLTARNIFINPQDHTQMRINNFGLFYLLDLNDIFHRQSHVDFFTYTSPEQTGLLKRPVDNRSDLYSLGAIFYELLCAQPPFEDQDIGRLIYKHLAFKPQKPSTFNPHIPPIIDEIILKLLAKEPDSRYQSAAGLKEDLEFFIKSPDKSHFIIALKDKIKRLNLQIKILGREVELKWLKNLYEEASLSNPRFVLAEGELGIGKTKLINSFIETTIDERNLVFTHKCSKASRNLPYAPYFDLIQEIFSRNELFPLKKRVKDSLGDGLKKLLSMFPFLLEDFPEYAENVSSSHSLSKITRDKKGTQELYLVLEQLFSILGDSPYTLMIFIDDIQWLDKDSVELTSHLIKELKNSKLMFLFTSREDEEEKTPRPLSIPQKNYTILDLKPLKEDFVPVFIEKMLSSLKQFPASFYKTILDKSSGNPFLIQEIIKTLYDKQILYFENYDWEINHDLLLHFEFENNITQLILKKLNSFSVAEMAYLKLIAVINKEFNLTFLTYFLEKVAAADFFFHLNKEFLAENTPSDLLIKLIDHCREKQLMEENLAKGKGFYLLHDKINEYLYRQIESENLQRLHLLCARTIEELYSEELSEKVFLLAYHYNQTEEWDKIFLYNELAFQKALDRYAYSEAGTYIRLIVDLKLEKKLYDSALLHLIIRMSRLLNTMGDISLSLKYLQQALKIARDLNLDELLMELNLEVGTGYYLLNDTFTSLQYYNSALKLAEEKNKEIDIPTPYTLIGSAYYFKFELEKAEYYFSKAIQYTHKDALDDLLPLCGLRSWVYSTFGDFEMARKDIQTIEANLHKISNPLMLSSLYHFCSLYYSWSGADVMKSLDYSHISYDYASRSNAAVLQYSSLYSRMSAYFLLSEWEQCETTFEQALSISKKTEVNIGIQNFWSLMALIHLYQQNFDKAHELAQYYLSKKETIENEQNILSFMLVESIYFYYQGNIEQSNQILDEALRMYEENHIAPLGIFFLMFKGHLLSKQNHFYESQNIKNQLQDFFSERKSLLFLKNKYQDLIQLTENSIQNSQQQKSKDSRENTLKEKIQLANIIKTSQMISSILDIDQLLEIIVEKTLEITGAERGALLLRNLDTQLLEFQVIKNIDAKSIQNKIFERVISQVENTQKGIIKTPGNAALFKELSSLGIKSVICTPLTLKGKVIGILYLDSLLLDRLFSEKELEVLEVFTVQATIAIENATLYKNLEQKVGQRTDELKNLNELSKLVNSTFNLREIIRIIYDTVHRFFGIEGIGVQAVDKSRKEIRFIEIYVPHIKQDVVNRIKEIIIPFSEEGGTSYRVAATRDYFFKKNINSEAPPRNYYDKIGLDTFQHKSILIIPLEVHHEVIGLIQFFSYSQDMVLSRDDISRLKRYANQVAAAINNSMLYGELEQKRQSLEEALDEVKKFNEINKKINSTLDINEVLDMIIEELERRYDFDGFGISIYDAKVDGLRTYKLHVPSLDSEIQSIIEQTVIPLNKQGGGVAKAFLENRAFYFRDIKQMDIQNNVNRTAVDFLHIRSNLILPFTVENKVLGVIQISTYNDKVFDLSDEDIEIIKRFISQMATAINNSKLYNELNQEKDNLKKLNVELKNTQTQLVQSEKMASLGQLTAGIAHEINNPLSFVINNNFIISQLIKKIQDNPELQKEKIHDLSLLNEKSITGLNRIKKIVENLRSFSRMDEGEQTDVDVNECILSTQTLLEHLFKSEITLINKLSPVPKIKGNAGQLNQVFMNMLVNGIDALEGQGAIEVETSFNDKNNRVTIKISDNGKGISPEIHSKIFDPFFTTKEVGKGTGLGLSISYGIVQNHQGDILLESAPNQGTTFILSFPALKPYNA